MSRWGSSIAISQFKIKFYNLIMYVALRIQFYIYILRDIKKLVIIFFTSKNTPNLINLSLLLKHKNEVKTTNWQKLKTKKPTNVYKTKPCSIKLPTTPCSYKINKKNYPMFLLKKKNKIKKKKKKKTHVKINLKKKLPQVPFFFFF